jgi:MFS transporter, CP family, cyanate transporter
MNSGTFASGRADTSRTAIIVCLLVLSFALRPGIVSIGPALPQIQHAFGLSYTASSLLTSIPDVCMGLFVLVLPGISRRLGVDRTLLYSLLLLTAAMLCRALSHSTPVLLVWTTMVGMGIAIAGGLMGGWIKKHFPDESSLFMGLYAGGLSVGATVAASGTGLIAGATGSWRIGVGTWCVLGVTAVVSWLSLTRRLGADGAHASQPAARTSIKLPWSDRRAWLLATFFGLSQFIAYACLAWIAPWNIEVHVSHIPGGLMLGMFTLLLAAGSFAAGALARKTPDRRLLLAIGSGITAVGFAGLVFAPAWLPSVFVALIAFGQGICFALGMTLPLDFADTPEDAHAWTMLVLFVGYLVAALGPFVFGFLRDLTGGFSHSFLTLLVVSLVTLALTPALRRSHR